MAKLFGIHELELLDGVSPEEFESFISSAYNPLPQVAFTPTLLSIFSTPRAQGPIHKVNASIRSMRSLLKGQSRSKHSL